MKLGTGSDVSWAKVVQELSITEFLKGMIIKALT